eukprot:365171-Chlamydomonas_euryale.AAC.10
MLVEVCKNPKNPGFNHYLFESVAALIKHVTAANPATIATFEQMLFPAFNLVLQQDVQEFHPYVFQVFAQLIELHSKPLPAVYMQIFPPLLSPVFWERSGNIPALVRLIQPCGTVSSNVHAQIIESEPCEPVAACGFPEKYILVCYTTWLTSTTDRVWTMSVWARLASAKGDRSWCIEENPLAHK